MSFNRAVTGLITGSLCFALALLLPSPAHAQETWDGGGGDADWSTDANWLDDTAPDDTAAGALIFTGSVQTATNVDIPFLGIDSILLDAGADAFSIGGSALTFTNGATITNGDSTDASALAIISDINTAGTAFTLNATSGDINLNNIDISGVGLVINGANNVGIAGVISGPGGTLTKNGAGTLTLLGASTYDGNTTVNGGTLDVGGVIAGDLLVNGSDTGNAAVTVVTVQANTPGTNGEINGSVDIANATLQLVGANALVNGTTLDNTGGVIDLNGDGSSIAVTGALTSDVSATLIPTITLAGDNSTIVADSLSNTDGVIRLTGSDTLIDVATTLTNSEALVNASIVLSGTNAAINGDVVNNIGAQLELNDTTTQIIGNVTNNGIVLGTGTITGNLTGTNDSLVVGGGLNSTTGESLNVGGDFELQSGGELRIELDPNTAGTGDKLDVTGNATFRTGSRIQFVDGAAGTFTADDVYVIASAGGTMTLETGVVVINGSVSDTGALMIPSVNGNDLELTVSDVLAFGPRATSANGAIVGNAVDAMFTASSTDPDVADAVSDWSGVTNTETILKELSPISYDNISTSNIQNASAFSGNLAGYFSARRQGVTVVANHAPTDANSPMLASVALSPELLAYALDERNRTVTPRTTSPGIRSRDAKYGREGFVRVFGVFDEQDGDAVRSGYEADSYGIFAGFDSEWRDDTLIGLSFGYVNTSVDLDGGRGKSDIDTFRVGPYLSHTEGPWFFDFSLTVGIHNSDNTRTLTSLMVPTSVTSDGDAWDLTLYGDIGYDYTIGNHTYLTPMLSILFVHYDEDGLTETGGPEALTIASRSVESLRTRLGSKITHTINQTESTVVLEGFFGWEHESLSGDADQIEASFVAGGGPFTINTGNPDENAAYFGGSATMLMENHTSLFLLYDATVYGDGSTHAVGGGITIRF